MQASVHEDFAMDSSTFISKHRKKKEDNEKNKNKAVQVKEKGDPKKKSRTRKLEKNDTFFEELAESEAAFFQTVKRVKKNLSSQEEEKMHFSRIQDFLSCCLERVLSRLLKH